MDELIGQNGAHAAAVAAAPTSCCLYPPLGVSHATPARHIDADGRFCELLASPPPLQERARKAAVHPTVDWLYAVLLAVQQLEEALLVAPTAGEGGAPAWSSQVADKVGHRPPAGPGGALYIAL